MLHELAQNILAYVTSSPRATYQELAVAYKVKPATIRRHVKMLRNLDLVKTQLVNGRIEIQPYNQQATWTPTDDTHVIHSADLFCGGGGFSYGFAKTLENLGYSTEQLDHVGINHSPEAIATHLANHPWARHVTEDIEKAQPRKLFPNGHLHVLLASPSCTTFSTARGGVPIEDTQLRTHAWQVVRWARDLDIDVIICENVWEFTQWGLLLTKTCQCTQGRSSAQHDCKNCRGSGRAQHAVKDGSIFRQWIRELNLLGYAVEYRKINAADYGDAQTRERFFLIARQNGKGITWPDPTHSKDGEVAGTKPWVGAKEILDLTEPSQSIFTRMRPGGAPWPLVPKTIQRIAGGLKDINGIDIEDWLLENYQDIVEWNVKEIHAAKAEDREPRIRLPLLPEAIIPSACVVDDQGAEDNWPSRRKSLDEPIGTVPGSQRWNVAQNHTQGPFILGQHGGSVARSINEPTPTIASAGFLRVIEAFVQPPNGIMGGDRSNKARRISDPLQTVTAGRGGGHVVQARILPNPRSKAIPRPRSSQEPVPTLTAHGCRQTGLMEPMLMQSGGPEGAPQDPRSPLRTVLTREYLSVSEPFLTPNFGERDGQKPRHHSLDDPLPVVTSRGAGNVIEPMLVEYYGKGRCLPVTAPMGTITTRDHFGLLESTSEACQEGFLLDILYRMLTTKELARAMGFPDDYQFHGTKKDVIRQIGNAVCVRVAEALTRAVLTSKAVTLNSFL